MDPVTIATITSAVTVVAAEVAKGIASAASKDIWSKIKGVLGWSENPNLSDMPIHLAKRLLSDAEIGRKLLEILQTIPADVAPDIQVPKSLVDKLEIKGGKVVVAGYVHTINL